MNRDQLIEAAVLAHYNNYFAGVADVEPAFQDQPESYQDRMRDAMKAAFAAIEAAGLCIMPVYLSKEMVISALSAKNGVSPLNGIGITYTAMIKAGKL